jgi:hypothetical protein
VTDVYAVGQPVVLSTTVKAAGVLTDPTALVLTVAVSGGATVTKHWPTPLEIAKDTTGTFHYAHTPTVAGLHRETWTSTGTAAGVDVDVFNVFNPALYPRLVSFADAKAFVRLQGTDDDSLLDRMVGWASARILIEVVAYASTYTQRVRARQGRLVLSRTPVREVTAIVPLSLGATVVDPADLLVLNPAHGLVVPDVGVRPYGLYDVTYTAGYDEVPPGVDGACLQLLQHWWNQSQAHGSATYGDTGFVPDFAGLPNSVTNKLAAAAPPVLMA